MERIGFGGNCHWCTEAIFLSLKGVATVEQGWISSSGDEASFSEAIIVDFNPDYISLELLLEVHLNTHSCTSQHSMRDKYRSAVYFFKSSQEQLAQDIIKVLQTGFAECIITKVIPFVMFKLNDEKYQNYYYSDPGKPFCQNIVNPKLKKLLASFPNLVDPEKLDLAKH